MFIIACYFFSQMCVSVTRPADANIFVLILLAAISAAALPAMTRMEQTVY